MTISAAAPGYSSHITLMILGDDLEPREISKLLGLRPNQSWRRGEPKRHTASLHQWGGWKKFIPESLSSLPLPAQLRHWVRKLRSKGGEISQLSRRGYLCRLDCYIASDNVATIIIPVELQKDVAALGLELSIGFFADESNN
jgi:hypothetical protein